MKKSVHEGVRSEETLGSIECLVAGRECRTDLSGWIEVLVEEDPYDSSQVGVEMPRGKQISQCALESSEEVQATEMRAA
jgi:hypothetical protein